MPRASWQRGTLHHGEIVLKKRIVLISAILLGGLITIMLVTAAIWPVINRVETGATPEYPEIQPLYYSAPPARVFDEVKAGVEKLEGFQVTKTDDATIMLMAETSMPVLGLMQDVEVKVEPVTEFVTRVHTISSSRHGKGDLGQNARNILEVQAELEQRLGALKFDPQAGSDKEEPATIPATE